MHPLRDASKIVVGCVALSCLLGWAVDLVTAHVAVEYFTVHHPHVLDSQSPLVMALVWGFIASWWCGLIAGVILALVNHRVTPPLPPTQILRWVAKGCAAIWFTMMAVLAAIYLVAGIVPLAQRRASFESDRRLMAVALAHMGEYILAAIAVAIIAVLVVRESKRLRRANP